MSWQSYNDAQNFDYSRNDYDQAESEVAMWSILKKHVIAGTYTVENAANIRTEIAALKWPWLDNDFTITGDIDLIEEEIDCLFTRLTDDDCMWDERKVAREAFYAVWMEPAELLEAAE